MIAARLVHATRIRFSVSTFLNRQRYAGLKAHRPYVGVSLTVRHQRLTLNCARGHYRFPGADGNVFFLRTNHASMFSLLTEDYGYGDRLEKAWMNTTLVNVTDMAVEAY